MIMTVFFCGEYDKKQGSVNNIMVIDIESIKGELSSNSVVHTCTNVHWIIYRSIFFLPHYGLNNSILGFLPLSVC